MDRAASGVGLRVDSTNVDRWGGVRKWAPLVAFIVAAGAVSLNLSRPESVPGNHRNASVVPGSALASREIVVPAGSVGRVAAVCVRDGEVVRRGETIALLEPIETDNRATQTAQPARAQESLDEFRSLARREEIRRVREQYEAALRRLQQAIAQRDILRAGTRPELVKRYKAWLEQAEATLALVREGPRKELIARYRASLESVQSRLSLLREGTRQEQIKQAEAALLQVMARRDLLKAGSRPEEIEQLKASVKQAGVSLGNAQSELKRAQQLAARGLISGQQVDQTRTQRDLALSQLRGAEQRLAEELAGARPEQIRDAEAQVEASRQRLAELKSGPRAQELREAELQVESARNQLAEAEAGPRPQEIAQAQASVDAAREMLAAAVAGPTPEEIQGAEAAISTAQAEVRAASASLDLVQAGAKGETLAANSVRGQQQPTDDQKASHLKSVISILAPADGKSAKVVVRVGDAVVPNTPIIRLIPGN